MEKTGIFSDERADFNVENRNFPEKTLCYINQEYLLTVKGGELVIYNHNFLFGQLIVETDVHEQNEVTLITSLYTQTNGEYLGLDKLWVQ